MATITGWPLYPWILQSEYTVISLKLGLITDVRYITTGVFLLHNTPGPSNLGLLTDVYCVHLFIHCIFYSFVLLPETLNENSKSKNNNNYNNPYAVIIVSMYSFASYWNKRYETLCLECFSCFSEGSFKKGLLKEDEFFSSFDFKS